jgi:hypothetical protein
MMKKLLVLSILLLVLMLAPATLVLSQPPAGPVRQDSPPDICQSDENLLPNCNFDAGMQGWQPFTEEGSAHFDVMRGGGECHAPLCPAGYIAVESHFVGGFYQQVPVQQGATYFANIVWLAFDSLSNNPDINAATGGMGRRVGIDPFGGTDPRSPSVVWGPENRRNDCKICDNQSATAQAQADVITVFIRIDDRWKLRAAELGRQVPPSRDQFWFDDIGLKMVAPGDAEALAAAPTEPPPTDTPVPPTDTPAPEIPTDTPEPPPPTATPEPPVEAELDLPVDETAAEPVAAEALALLPETPAEEVKVIAPPPTLTPTLTPTSTPTREQPVRIAAAISENPPVPAARPSALPAGLPAVLGTTICAGGAFLVFLGLVAAGLVWLYRLGWGEMKPGKSDEEGEYGEDMIVEAME